MSYRSFCSLVLQQGAPHNKGSESEVNGGQKSSSSTTKMTSIVQISKDDLVILEAEDRSEDGFSDKGERCDFFDRNNEFLNGGGDRGVTCAASHSVTSRLPDDESKEKLIVSREEMNQTELSLHCEGASEKVVTTSANGVIQIISDKNLVLAESGRRNLEARSSEDAKVSFVSNSEDALVSPSKITMGNTTKVYLNAEENEENETFLSLTIPVNGVDILETISTECKDAKEEKAEMSETESDAKTETSETESETKTSDECAAQEITITQGKEETHSDAETVKFEVSSPAAEDITLSESHCVNLKNLESHEQQIPCVLEAPPANGEKREPENLIMEVPGDQSCRNEAVILDGSKEDCPQMEAIKPQFMVSCAVENDEVLNQSEELRESLTATDASTPLTSIDSLMNDVYEASHAEAKNSKKISYPEAIGNDISNYEENPPLFQNIASGCDLGVSCVEENYSPEDERKELSPNFCEPSDTSNTNCEKCFAEAPCNSSAQFSGLDAANIKRNLPKEVSEHEANIAETFELPAAQESSSGVGDLPQVLPTAKDSDGTVFSNTSVSQSDSSAQVATAVDAVETIQEESMAPIHTLADCTLGFEAQKQLRSDPTPLETMTSLESRGENRQPVPQLEVVQISELSAPSTDDSDITPTLKRSFTTIRLKEGEVDVASILEQKQTTKLYWEHKMAATAAPPAEDLGWEPVANVCFRDPNATPDTDIPEETGAPATTSAGTDFLPAPPPQFDSTPPVSIQEAKDAGHKLEQEKIISLDDEISVLEREVLGEVVASDVDEDIEDVSPRFVEESVKTNHKYVYGEEGAQEDVPKVLSVVQNRRGDPDRLPTVKSTYGAATQCKENVIEAEIRAQQERERELQLEQMKKKELLQQTSNSVERHKGASSPQDSDEGFVDPPVERSKLEGATKQTVSVVCNGGGYAHLVTDPHGDSVIYDAVEPPKLTSPRTQLETPSPVPPKAAPKPAPAPVPHTTETKIALEIRELKEREEELRRMREARQGVKKVNSGAHEEEAQEDFAEVDIEDVEDKGSSSSREILDDHLTSLTTTTDEGNFSECGDATSSEDKSSNGSNSRIMSPEVPSVEFPRPPRRVTVRPFQADDDEDRPVYTRMKNESVIEREIRIAKERDEAYKKEKGLLSATPAAPKSSNGAVTNGVVKHAPLQHSVSLSAVQNGSSKGAQHQLATSRIQMEIAENGQRERELMSAGKVLTLSEDTVDDKVTRLSDLADLPTAQEVRTKSPVSSTSVNSSTRQSPAVSPSSTLSSSSRASNSGLSNGHHFNGSTMTRLTKSLSTTNLSSPQSSLSSTGTTMRPKGLMEKFIASRGKMTPSAFASPPPAGGGPNRVVVTRPMRVQPKKPVLLRQHSNDSTDGGSIAAPELRPEGRTGPSPPPLYKRVIGAEEKIQEELREMQQREEELKRLRSKNLTARSQPNLLEMSLNEIPFEDDHSSTAAEDETDTATETEDSADTVIRAAVSNPNLADDVSENIALKKSARRRSALIAEWENRIQSTAAVDA